MNMPLIALWQVAHMNMCVYEQKIVLCKNMDVSVLFLHVLNFANVKKDWDTAYNLINNLIWL